MPKTKPTKIPLQKEQPPLEPAEGCCFCDEPTHFWTALEDRDDGGQVPCCVPCAHLHKMSEVPSKAKWCASEPT